MLGNEIKTTRLPITPDGKSAIIQQFVVSVTAGPDEGRSLLSQGERLAIGIHDSNDLVLHDSTVSRFHCEIRIVDGRALVSDLQSSNGTGVEGVPVLNAFLRDGVTLSLGRTKIKFRLAKEEVKLPLSSCSQFGLLVGNSATTRAAFALLERAAASDTSVLLTGETGTGKEVAAESIHQESQRRDGPFVVVDCGAIPDNLLESELFGHERGAFSGADRQRIGAFEAASGGTLFLDEIGELSLDQQPKLLRAIEEKRIKRVGGNGYHACDIRIIAATHRQLRADVNSRRFRPDLYFRLAVLEIRLPSLKERLDDLPLLVERLLSAMPGAERTELDFTRSAEFVAHLATHDWPGNVRELRSYLEQCVALSRATDLESAAFSESATDISVPLLPAREAHVKKFEREYLEKLLLHHAGNTSQAARIAGLSRAALYRMLRRHGLR